MKHYQNIDDEIVNKGASNISTLYERQQDLQIAVNRFEKSPYIFTMISGMSDIKQQVWQRFEGQIILKRLYYSRHCCSHNCCLACRAYWLFVFNWSKTLI
ncbi:DUF2937 family protein [Pseudoalteromonas sp. B193]